METYWKPDFANWKNVDLNALKHVEREAMKRVDFILALSARITDRAWNLLLFVFPLLSACIISLMGFAGWEILTQFHIRVLLVVTGITLLFVIYWLVQLISPRESIPPGREPQALATSKLMEHDGYVEQELEKSLTIISLKNYQSLITYMNESNDRRIKKVEKCVVTLQILFGFDLLFMAVSTIVTHFQ